MARPHDLATAVIVEASRFYTIDLSQGPWQRIPESVLPKWVPAVYVVRHKRGWIPLKVGETEAWHGRLRAYQSRAAREGKEIVVDVVVLPKVSGRALVPVQDAVRNHLESLGYDLPWDNTYRRLGADAASRRPRHGGKRGASLKRTNPMKPRPTVRAVRREEIIEAAVAVIAEQGFQNLSLSEIEKKAGMSRGQLTYYFPTKEAILLAVFDRLLQLMYARVGQPAGPQEGETSESGWEWIEHLLKKLVGQPPVSPEFHCLQYTFLSQIGHRDDFRERLATLYEEWRTKMAGGLAKDMEGRQPVRNVDPRALATLVQALLHGLTMQQAAQSGAFDRAEMVGLCLDMLGNYLWGAGWMADGGQPGPPAREPVRNAAAHGGREPVLPRKR